MKITVIGAGGVRTPLLLQAISARQERLGLHELALMDIDAGRLELIGAITSPLEKSGQLNYKIIRTTDRSEALRDADFVITTFRIGGVASRIVDERVPLNNGVLGQETTGAGGLSMGLRSIPVILDYVSSMKQLCPDAWLINFANPAGMLTEAVLRYGEWQRVVGICDAPASMRRIIAAILEAKPEEIYIDYVGLNHLGWIKRVIYHENDELPTLLNLLASTGSLPEFPFDTGLVSCMRLIPNEYLYYYYYNRQAVSHIQAAGECRGEQIERRNKQLFSQLKEKYLQQDYTGMQTVYQEYLEGRSSTYMANETGRLPISSGNIHNIFKIPADDGYAGVALNLIESLTGNQPRVQILNVPNHGSVAGMQWQDVVEIPTEVSQNQVMPLSVSEIPGHCIGLMQQVKHVEHLIIEASVEKSYDKALTAFALHPLVQDYKLAQTILDEYISNLHEFFPNLH